MKAIWVLIAAFVIVAAVFGGYYFFIDTLTFTQLSGSTGSGIGDMIMGAIDFDTGVTRYERFRFKMKSDYYGERLKEVNGKGSLKEKEELAAELMQDPVIKKLTQKAFSLGGKGALEIAKMLI